MLKYFIEIKHRLFLLILNSLFTLIIVYYYKEILICVIIQSCNVLSIKNLNSFYFIFTDVTEMFSVYIEMIFFLCSQIFIIFFFYHVGMFLNFALFKKEYSFFKVFFKSFLFTWIISVFIAWKLVIPLTFFFFLSFQNLLVLNNSFKIHFEAKIIEYFDFYTYFYYLCIFHFQLVSLILLMFKYMNYNLEQIKRFRKLYYFCFTFCSTLLCIDVFTQFLLIIFFIVKYEFFVLFFIFRKNVKKNLI